MARFNKGEFILVPNKSVLKGMKPQLQCLFMWLCEYSDIDDSTCYPSRKRLASDCGVSLRTIDGYIKELIEAGLISKENRFSDNEKLTNLYTVLELEKKVQEVVQKKGLPRAENDTTPRADTAHRINPIRINPLNTISKDIEPKGFGNTDINEIVSFYKEKLQLPQLDGTIKANRYAASRVLKKANGNVAMVKKLIECLAADDFHSANASSITYLDKHAVAIMQRARKNNAKVVQI